MTEIPQPEDIYRRTREEGARRLDRPLLEMVSTALAAGFDIVAGVVALALVATQLAPWVGKSPAHVFASVGFGTALVFLVVGRGELFTEKLPRPDRGPRPPARQLVARAGEALDHLRRSSTSSTARHALAAAGSMLGGLGFVTLNRLTQGKQGERNRASA